MLKYLIFLFPILQNYLTGGMYFITAQRFTEAGSSSLVSTSTSSVWGIAYAIFCIIIGKIVTEKRAPWLIIAAAFSMAVTSLGFIVFDGIYTQFLWIALYGIESALYCAPFQVFMRRIGGGGTGIVYSTAMYTAAWSLGQATGPFVFGVIEPWQNGYYLNAAIAFILGIMVLLIQRVIERRNTRTNTTVPDISKNNPSPDGNSIENNQNIYAGRADLYWVGCLGAAFGAAYLMILQPLGQIVINSPEFNFPNAKMHAGFVRGLILLSQTILSLMLVHNRTFFMYNPRTNIIRGLIGALSMLIFAFGKALPVFYIGAIAFAIYSSYFYFMLVFHALVHPTKNGQYAARNEVFVGMGCILGPFFGGWLADIAGTRFTFCLCAAMIIIGMILQSIKLASAEKAFKQQQGLKP